MLALFLIGSAFLLEDITKQDARIMMWFAALAVVATYTFVK